MKKMISKPFQTKRTDEERAKDKRKTWRISLNLEEEAFLMNAAEVLEQPKQSTLLKSLAMIGARKVLHDSETQYILKVLFKNKRNNARLGIVDFE